jgi:hypothetical protein
MHKTVSELLPKMVKPSSVVHNSHKSHKMVISTKASCLPSKYKHSVFVKLKPTNSKSESKVDRKNSVQVETQILRDLVKIFKLQKVQYIRTRDLIAYLCADPSKPWASYYRGSNLTARHLSALLKPWGVSSCCLYYKEGNAKGYKLSAVTQAFRRIND